MLSSQSLPLPIWALRAIRREMISCGSALGRAGVGNAMSGEQEPEQFFYRDSSELEALQPDEALGADEALEPDEALPEDS